VGLEACCPERQITLWIIGASIAIFLFLFSIPGIIGGIGLFKHKNWARILVLILSVIDLFNISVGTAIDVYSIWVLVQDETVKLFAN
jgi:Ni,Fe-hydrogenase I cytochrome b subunit